MSIILSTLFLFLIVSILLVFISVNRTTIKSMNLMSEPESLLKTLWDKSNKDGGFYETLTNYAQDHKFMDKLAESQMWTKDYDFVPDIIFEFNGIINSTPLTVITWRNLHASEFFILYYHPQSGKIVYVFTREFADEKSLTTSSNRSSLSLPQPPDSYHQVFEKLNIGLLYSKHIESVEMLKQKELVKPSKAELPANTIYLFVSSLKKHSAHVKRLPFWQFKGVYWFFVRQNILVNKAISV